MRRPFRHSPLSIILLLGLRANAQVSEAPKVALERPGLHHATVEGRFVSPDGAPVSGVHVQLSAGRIRALPLRDVVTGQDGRFSFRDVSSAYPPDLRWYPPEQWLRGISAIGSESGSIINVGTIELQPNTIVRAIVELVGGPPMQARARPSVALRSKTEFGSRVGSTESGDYHVLRQIPFDEGTWEVALFTGNRIERYEAPFRMERGKQGVQIRLRLLRDALKSTDKYSATGTLEVQEEIIPSVPIEREFRARGRVLAPDGSPISGAIISLAFLPFEGETPQWTRTTSDGGFDFKYTATKCYEPSVSYGLSDYIAVEGAVDHRRDNCETRWASPQDLVLESATRLAFQVEGIDATSVRASWWHDSFGWTEFSSLRPWISLSGFPPSILRVEASDLLPLAQATELPFRPERKNLPTEIPVPFRYDPQVHRTLTVTADGQPLSNAVVDVEKVESLVKNQRIRVGTYHTSASGQLRLAGGGDQLVEVFVYAQGYEPRRAIWVPGKPLILDLARRDVLLTFQSRPGAGLVRIRPVANPDAAVTVNLATTGQRLMAPGEYDVTSYNDRGAVMGYQRVSLTASETRTVDPSVDERPRLTVRFPATGWKSGVTESTPRGGAVNWVAVIAVAGTLELEDVPATKIQSLAQEDVYLLSRAGHIQVHVQREDSPILWREITVRPRESLIIDAPAGEATLEAPSNFDPGKGHVHGIAGPRMQLIADDPSAWSITEFIPKQSRNGTFVIRGIPPGNYHLYHHLFNGKVTYTFAGKTYTSTATPAAWGGVAVHLVAGKTTRIPSLNSKLGILNVKLSDAAGRQINNATVRIRDRMSDSWRQVEENPAQVEQAGLPIPYPAAVRVIEGKVTLPQIRSGWLEFAVETDAGQTYSYTMPVTLGQELKVTVPADSIR